MIEKTIEEFGNALLKTLGGISQKTEQVIKPKKQKDKSSPKSYGQNLYKKKR